MLVRCPRCKTTYKVADEVVKGESPAFRCSRCKHTFELEVAQTENGVVHDRHSSSEPDAETKPKEQELIFPFAPPESQAPAADPGQQELLSFPLEPIGASGEQTADAALWSLPAVNLDPKDEEPFTISEKTGLPGDERRDNKQEPGLDDARFHSIPPVHENAQDQQASTAPYWSLFAILTVLFSCFTVFHKAYPNVAEEMIKKIPLLGPALIRNNHLKSGVGLKSVRGDYQVIQGNREVFVVTGVATNQNPVVLREMRVGGRIYNQEGKEIEQQSMWVGNAISPKIIRGMTAQDVLDLQRLKPLKSFEIPPGDSVPFTIVFLKPARDIRSFTFEVLTAEGKP